jgi:uncharacterized protein YtpQ (UPF0354 family)
MKRVTAILLAIVALCYASSALDVMSPKEFTRDFADALGKAKPELKVVSVGDLELKVTFADGHSSTSFLDNAYDMYKQDPKTKAAVIQRFIASAVETTDGVPKKVDRARIVPVIKDRPWLEETRKGLASRGTKEAEIPKYVFEDFSPDLIIVYAEDSPKNMRYLCPKNLEEAKISRTGLRSLAIENLKRLLPNIECRGGKGLYMITAGGDYDASVLLFDSIWSGKQMEVKGDFVVAVPTRDLLLVTGSEDLDGIEKVKSMVEQAWTAGSYKLTQKLFVYRNGKFNEFTAK